MNCADGAGISATARRCPRWISGPEAVWENVVRLFEDFIVVCLFFRFKPGLTLYHGAVEKGSPQSPWRVATQAEFERAIAQGLIRAEPDE